MQPAHQTKHIPLLQISFQSSSFFLRQLDDGRHNGTAIWLAGQALALTLPALLRHKGKAIELGSGIGFTALALCSMGWDVLATDTNAVLSAVLKHNIDTNRHRLPLGSGNIQVRELDWTVPPEDWSWSNPTIVASPAPTDPERENQSLLCPPFDLILTADTVYSQELVCPLMRSLAALSVTSPPTYIALERRDPRLADDALSQAQHVWQFSARRIPHKKVLKAIAKSGCRWNKAEWEGVEIWKLTKSVCP